MSNTENSNEQGMQGDPPEQQVTGKQTTARQQLLALQSDIEEQCHRVTLAIHPIAEALDNEGNVSLEMMNHLKAQLLRAHLYLDDLKQLLDAIG